MQLELIKKEDFAKLNKTEQVNIIFHQGRELFARFVDDNTVCLYALSGFFAEIWYKNPGRKIDRIDICTIDYVTRVYSKEIELLDLF